MTKYIKVIHENKQEVFELSDNEEFIGIVTHAPEEVLIHSFYLKDFNSEANK